MQGGMRGKDGMGKRRGGKGIWGLYAKWKTLNKKITITYASVGHFFFDEVFFRWGILLQIFTSEYKSEILIILLGK